MVNCTQWGRNEVCLRSPADLCYPPSVSPATFSSVVQSSLLASQPFSQHTCAASSHALQSLLLCPRRKGSSGTET